MEKRKTKRKRNFRKGKYDFKEINFTNIYFETKTNDANIKSVTELPQDD